MKRLVYHAVIIVLSIIFCLPDTGCADNPKARQIMEKVEQIDSADSVVSNMTMILIDKNDKERVREIRTFSKKKDGETKSITFFVYPADVKDSGFLTISYGKTGKEDDQWLYLPRLKKVKRIASSEKGGSFMGSDFSYSDMSPIKLGDYNLELEGEREVRGHNTWVIQVTPRTEAIVEETGYKTTYLCVRQDNYVVVQAVMVMNNGGFKKYLDVKKLEKIDGYWVATETHMTKKKGKQFIHKTVLKIESVKYNQALDDGLFTTRRLEKGL